jgi:hypothetical protein
MCGKISTANSSPALTDTGGLRLTPTPAGVPVKMTVPACRVVPCDRKLMSLGMLKMRSLGHVSKKSVTAEVHVLNLLCTTVL